MRLRPDAQPDPIHGTMHLVCMQCYESREGYAQQEGQSRLLFHRFKWHRDRHIAHLSEMAETLTDRVSQLRLLNDSAELRRKFSQRQLEESVVPWQSDVASLRCSVCQCVFGMLMRRHHCRLCGRVVCSAESCASPVRHEDDAAPSVAPPHALLSTADSRSWQRLSAALGITDLAAPGENGGRRSGDGGADADDDNDDIDDDDDHDDDYGRRDDAGARRQSSRVCGRGRSPGRGRERGSGNGRNGNAPAAAPPSITLRTCAACMRYLRWRRIRAAEQPPEPPLVQHYADLCRLRAGSDAMLDRLAAAAAPIDAAQKRELTDTLDRYQDLRCARVTVRWPVAARGTRHAVSFAAPAKRSGAWTGARRLRCASIAASSALRAPTCRTANCSLPDCR